MNVSMIRRALCFKCLSILSLVVILVAVGCQQKPEESEPNNVISLLDPNSVPSTPGLDEKVAASVNGIDITNEKVDQLIQSEMKPYQASPEKF